MTMSKEEIRKEGSKLLREVLLARQLPRGPAMVPALREEREFNYTPADFERARKLIKAFAGIHLTDAKRDMVYSRLARRLRVLNFTSCTRYLDFLEQNPEQESQAFVNALTTNLTSFFREEHHFDMLKDAFLRSERDMHKIWCCAASTGEEPYSIAIAACEAFGTFNPPVRILATDIDTQVLDAARLGVYATERIEELSEERRQLYFLKGTGPREGFCKVKPELQALVEFRPLNLLHRDYGLKGDFFSIFCRNVMIYFDKPTQREVLSRLMPLLGEDGIFFAGHAESFSHAPDLVAPCGRTAYRHPRRR